MCFFYPQFGDTSFCSNWTYHFSSSTVKVAVNKVICSIHNVIESSIFSKSTKFDIMSTTAAETAGNAPRYLKISIRDPIKSTDTFGQYVCYNVESSSNIPGFVYGEVSVIRRYSDFAWLAEQLSKACPGAIVPALPEKQAVGRFQADFVETRRRALERFLLRVAAHVELNVVPAFIAFLQANDATLKTMKNQAMEKKVQPYSDYCTSRLCTSSPSVFS